MYNKIIVALALDHGISETAMAKAKLLLNPGGQIIALHIHEIPSGMAGAYLAPEDIERARATAEAQLKDRIKNVPGAKSVLVNGHTGRAITDYAKSEGADCIIMGSHKPGLSDYLLGSTAARIVRHAHCTVVVLR